MKEDGMYLNITAPVKTFQMIITSVTTNKKIIQVETVPEKVEDLIYLRKLVEEGALKKVVVDKTYTLDHFVEAHTSMQTKDIRKGMF